MVSDTFDVSDTAYARRMTRLAALVLLVGLLGSCGGVDRGAYVRGNERTFAQLPAFPGSRLVRRVSTEGRDEESGPVTHYVTRYEFRLPATATRAEVAAFFRRRLEPRWRLVENLQDAVFNYRRGRASLSVNLENAPVHGFELGIDHAFYPR